MGITALAREVETDDADTNNGNVILPQENTDNKEGIIEEVILDETVKAEDLEVSKPRILPDSRFYFLKEWRRSIRSVFTFNKVKKAELESRFANERLIEIKAMVERNKGSEAVKKAITKYEKALGKVKSQTEKIEETAQQNPKVEKFMEKYTHQQVLHQKILEKLEEKVPAEAFEKIKEAREEHLEGFKGVMLNLEEKVAERLEKTLEQQGGSKFKKFKDLEILKRIKGKMPEDVKEDITETEERVLKQLKEKLELLPNKEQEKFGKYIGKISGDKEKQLEIVENLKAELKENPGLREKLLETRGKILETAPIVIKAKKIRCPVIEKPSQNFCKDGRIVFKKNSIGCIVDFECIIPAEVENPEDPGVCITLWDPVCGQNGKTYSNKCFANLAGVEIAYKGKCKEKECETDTDCPQLKCGSTGTTDIKCIGVKSKCINGKCIIVEEQTQAQEQTQTQGQEQEQDQEQRKTQQRAKD